MRWRNSIFAAIIVALGFISAQADVTVTGNVRSILGGVNARSPRIRFTLQNYGAGIPSTSTGVLTELTRDVTVGSGIDGAGNVNFTLAGNDEINPSYTYYTIEFYGNGTLQSSTQCYVKSPNFSVNNVAACVVNTNNVGIQTVVMPYPTATSLGGVLAKDCRLLGPNYTLVSVNSDGSETCNPTVVLWGNVNGQMAAQTDLTTALNSKLSFIPNPGPAALGGVNSGNCSQYGSNYFETGINPNGSIQCAPVSATGGTSIPGTAADGSNGITVQGNVTVGNGLVFGTPYSAATKPTVNIKPNFVIPISDGPNCVLGGGSAYTLCFYDGTKWNTVGGSGNMVAMQILTGYSAGPLANGTKNQPYSQQLLVTGGTQPYTWTLSSGSLPTGLSLLTSGVVSGTPTVAGSQTFTVQVLDSALNPQAQTESLTINIADTAQAVAPVMNPPAGTYSGPQTIIISSPTPGAAIYYTTDGSTPTTSSSLFSSTLVVSASETVKAIAHATSYSDSAVSTAVYTIVTQAATPTFSTSNGSLGVVVSISCTAPNPVIYATIDGSTPTHTSSIYSGPITINSSTTVKAICTSPGFQDSNVGSQVVTVSGAATPTFSVPGGTYNTPQTIAISDTTTAAVIRYTLDGSTPTVNSTLYASPVTLSTSTILQAIAYAPGYGASTIASATYNIQAATPSISPAGGTYASQQTISMSCSTSGSSIYYSVNGSTPTHSSSLYSGPFFSTSIGTQIVRAMCAASGYADSNVVSQTYTITPQAATPSIGPSSGTYVSPLTVSMSCGTPSSTIYYSLSGIPNHGSPIYGGPFAVTSSTSVYALCSAPNYSDSSATSVAYTIYAPLVQTSPDPLKFINDDGGGTYTYQMLSSGGYGGTIWNITGGAPSWLTANGSGVLTATPTKAVFCTKLTCPKGTLPDGSGDYPGYVCGPVTYSLSVQVKDSLNNTTNHTYTFNAGYATGDFCTAP